MSNPRRKFNFTISGKLAGANELRQSDRSHWSRGARHRKAELAVCIGTIVTQVRRNQRIESPVRVDFQWFEPDMRRDIDNVIAAQKVILDAIVHAQLLPGDSQKWVRQVAHSIQVDRTNPRIVVTVEEIENGEHDGGTVAAGSGSIFRQGTHNKTGLPL